MNRELHAALDAEADPRVAEEVGQAAGRGSRKLLILLGIAMLLFALLHFTAAGERLRDGPAMRGLMEAGDFEAALWFVGITVVLMAAGTPRLIFYALGGFAFGFWGGLGLSLLASLIASFLVFRVARWGGRDWLIRRFGHRPLFARIVAVQPTVLSVALVRCLPVSNVVINIALALSTVGNRAFVWGTLIGFLPQGVVAVLLGSGVSDDVALEGAVQLVAAGVIALVFLAYSLWRRRTRGA
ncbi:MAG: VTT domain-containing protein [Pseudazoarcus pumilus]|nr:VTT domain-containing protein [Pseudazoarcus pumilus]